MLPKSLVAVVIGLAFLPIILNGLGIRFSAAPAAVGGPRAGAARILTRGPARRPTHYARARSFTSSWNGRRS